MRGRNSDFKHNSCQFHDWNVERVNIHFDSRNVKIFTAKVTVLSRAPNGYRYKIQKNGHPLYT